MVVMVVAHCWCKNGPIDGNSTNIHILEEFGLVCVEMTSSRFNNKATELLVKIWLDCFSNELKRSPHAK